MKYYAVTKSDVSGFLYTDLHTKEVYIGKRLTDTFGNSLIVDSFTICNTKEQASAIVKAKREACNKYNLAKDATWLPRCDRTSVFRPKATPGNKAIRP